MSFRTHVEAWQHSVRAGLRQVGDPWHLEVFADRPELGHLVETLFLDGCRWAEKPRRAMSFPGGGTQLAHEVVRRTADDFASERQISPELVSASVFLLAVQGGWWEVVAPGVVLCSSSAAVDATLARTLLRAGFDSRLAGRA